MQEITYEYDMCNKNTANTPHTCTKQNNHIIYSPLTFSLYLPQFSSLLITQCSLHKQHIGLHQLTQNFLIEHTPFNTLTPQ